MVDTAIPEENWKRDLSTSAIYIFLTILLGALGFFVLTRFGGFTSEIDKTRFWTFSIMFLIFDVAIIIFKIGKNTFLKNISWTKYIYFPLHDSELGFFRNVKLVSNPFNLLVLSVLIFSILGFVGSVSTQASVYLFPLGAGQVAQETTDGGRLIMGLYNSPAENSFLYIILFTSVTAITFVLGKYFKVPFKTAIIAGLIIGAPLSSIAWGEIHTGVSGSDEVRGLGHFIFGFNGAFMTIATGSIIPFEVYHITNNLFARSRDIYGSEVTIALFVGLSVAVIILVALFFYFRAKIRGRNDVLPS